MKNSDDGFIKFALVALTPILWLAIRILLITLIYNKIVASTFTLPVLTYWKTLCVVALFDLLASRGKYEFKKRIKKE